MVTVIAWEYLNQICETITTMPLPLKKDHLIAILEKHLAINADHLSLSTVKNSDFDLILEAKIGEARYTVRIGPADGADKLFLEEGGLQREVDLLALLQAKTSLPVAEVVAADFDRTLIDRDFYISRKLAGTPYSQAMSLAHEDHNRIFFQLGQYLRELHDLAGSAFGYEGSMQSVWYEAFKTMWLNLIQDVVACGMYDAQEAADLTALLDYHRDSFDRDALPALLYMSSQKENIMIDPEGNITGLKGFELSLWGDPEMDFAVLDCAGIWASSFWDGYGQSRPDDPASRVRRKFYILYEFQRNMPLAIWRLKDQAEAEQTKHIALTIAKNLVVEEADQAP